MNRVSILNCHEIGCPDVLLKVYEELCTAFNELGYSVETIHSIQSIQSNSIVFLGNTIRCNNPAELLLAQSPTSVYFGWYWQDIDTSSLPNFINIYENMKNPTDYVVRNYSKPNHCPLLLRASEHPDKIATYPRTDEITYFFSGWKIQEHLIPTRYSGVYNGITDSSKYLSYDERRNFYLKSIFALGLQSDENVQSQHVSQRIYEGMAYGCIVITNSKPAVVQTNGIAVYANTVYDIEAQMEYYLTHPIERLQKQVDGYKFVKEQGTNRTAIQVLLNARNNCLRDMKIVKVKC
jgi:hypothetical protein